MICEELQNYEPPFTSNVPLVDAVRSFGLEFWDFAYDPFIAVFAPLSLQFPKILLKNDSIDIRISCSNSINPDFFRVTIGGRKGSDLTLPQLSLKNFTRNHSGIALMHHFDNPYPGIDGVMMKIYYLRDLLDDCYVPKSN